ncbi:hypothetical protein L1047_15390 [Synechococcus sp. Nb3U1]|uniref:hypothetical protein n=1 Tax=Synechococcus sp. Nb3U1 TaxID=1914529 RepID=UPI001F20200E|nr:hypothetical protein [Synechococcus sp. Nb3U1]MCF2972578.1 hypothetical protein [Synechococcus sp. Nb3U1]
MVRVCQGLGVVGVLLGSLALWELGGLAQGGAVDCPLQIRSAAELANLSWGVKDQAARGFDSARDKH